MSNAILQMEQRLTSQNTGGRRTAPRFDASAIPHLKGINQVGGPEVKLINISRNGALIESRKHMSPGSSISLRIVTTNTVYHLKGRIVRSGTSSMNDQVFQSAIAFDDDFTILPPSTNK